MSAERKDDGGPAFPRPFGTDEHDKPCNSNVDQIGMSLRDWFAGQALPACYRAWVGQRDGKAIAAAEAYEMADLMLEARKQ